MELFIKLDVNGIKCFVSCKELRKPKILECDDCLISLLISCEISKSDWVVFQHCHFWPLEVLNSHTQQ